MAKKLTTEEILARARAEVNQGQDSSAESAPPAAEEAAPAAPAESTESDSAAPAAAESGGPPPKTPGSTADILAMARKQATEESASAPEETPAADSKPAPSAAPAAGGPPPKTPKSTADILAMARAQTGKPAAAASQPASKPAGGKAKAAAAAPTGDTPSVKEMLQAVRPGAEKSAAADAPAAKPAKPTLPPMPVKPPASPKPKAKSKSKDQPRRTFLAACFAPMTLAWSSFIGASTAFLLGCARFMMPNVLVEPPTKFTIGPPSDYPPGTVSTKWKAARGVWIVNTDSYNGDQLIYALSSVCTHLGCTPNWLEGEQKFKCPCHGSGFYISGVNFEGPAPRPLERVGIRIAADGSLEVDKSVKFQEELGQWEDATSYVSVV